jgi:hypothetical protein
MVKVEKILKGSLDLIPSPSVKIQIIGGKVCLRCKDKTLLAVHCCVQKFVDIPCFALLPQINFPDNNFQIQAIFLNLFHLKISQ